LGGGGEVRGRDSLSDKLPLLNPLPILNPLHRTRDSQAPLDGVAELVGVPVAPWGCNKNLGQTLDREGGGGEVTEETEEVMETDRKH